MIGASDSSLDQTAQTAQARARGGAEVRVGVIGLGRMGRMHAENLARVPGLRLVAVADPDRDRLVDASEQLGADRHMHWHELVERDDVDALLICSPSAMHCEQVIAGAETAKHMFCEKPIDLELDRIDEALRAVDRAGVTLQLGFNRRADRNFAALRARVADGMIGPVWQLRITSRDPAPQPLAYIRTSGGLFADMTIHDFDLARFVTGREVAEVSAIGSALVDPNVATLQDVDCAVVSMRFDDGSLGIIENCRQAAVGYDQRVELHGAAGTLLAENERTDTVVRADATGVHHSPIPGFLAERYHGAYLTELQHFSATLIQGAPVIATGEDGRRAAIIAAAAKRAMDERRVVTIAEIEA
jgi:myo-inositol 2-dehydrogenase/D-chiro-inositol 1-dehydrogenase